MRQEKRQAAIEAKWSKKEETELPPPNAAVLQDIKATERRITEFSAALSVAKETGEAFPGEIHRLEQKIEECERKLTSEAAKETERKKQLEKDKAELELAKRSSARAAEVSVLLAAMVPSLRMVMATYKPEPLEEVVTKLTARLGSEAETSVELMLATDVLTEMKISIKHATEPEVRPQIAMALEIGKSPHKPHASKVKQLVVSIAMAVAAGVRGPDVTQAKQLADGVLDAWLVTSTLVHSTRLGRKHLLAASLKRAHDNAGFNAHSGTEGRKAMEAALQTVKEQSIDISSVPAQAPKKDLAVRGVGGMVVIHMPGGGSESFSNRLRLSDVIEQIAAKHKLGKSTHYGLYQCTRAGTGDRLLSCGEGGEMTLGQVCSEWIAQANRYTELMGSKTRGDSAAQGDAKFNYRLFFARKLVYGDSLSSGAEGDSEQLYWYVRKRVDTGFYKVSEDDVLTLAAMRMQIELGDHTSETMGKLKVVLKDFIPHTVKNVQTPKVPCHCLSLTFHCLPLTFHRLSKEWLEDLCTIHSRMIGFDAAKCKDNYTRMCMGYETFGFTMFTVRQTADPDKPHLNTKVWVGVNYRVRAHP